MKLKILVFFIAILFFGFFQNNTYAASIDSLKTELSKIQSDNKYIGALLFNAFGTNTQPEFSSYVLSDFDIKNACNGACGKIGINSAIWYSQPDSFYQRAKDLGMPYTLEIATTDVNTVVNGLNSSHNHSAIPIIRIGVTGNSGGFDSAQAYVGFLRSVDAKINFPVFALSGPNEAEAEAWATPNCTPGDAACIGRGVTAYMKTVVAGAGNLPHIKLLSPAFNMTSSVSINMVKEMIREGAPFSSVVAIAGNSYNFQGKTITEYVDEFMSATGLMGKNIFLTETGSIDNTTSGPTPIPYEPKDVPCSSYLFGPNTTTDPEFHSLRPYPASPCYKQIKQTALFCGNDLVVKKTYKDLTDCNPNAGGEHTCTYSLSGEQVGVSINLANAKLPVLGNTEDVPNGTWTAPTTSGNNLSAAERMNNYVSWYLNGVINRAEEDFSAFDPNYLVNYAGPLNKLLPFAGQVINRLASINDATTTPSKPATDNTARHDQIVGCPWVDKLYGLGITLPCYINGDFVGGLIDSAVKSSGVGDQLAAQVLKATLGKNLTRLTDWNKWMPPVESNYSSFPEYWKAYLTWRGNVCSPNLFGTQFYLCTGLTNAFTVWSQMFAHTPSSTTEDRVGEVFTDKTVGNKLEHTSQPNPGEVHNVSFTPDNDNLLDPGCTDKTKCASHHNLYFAHTQEVAKLSQNLQNTFATKSDSTNDWETAIQNNITLHEPMQNGGRQPIGDNYFCEHADAVTTAGDNLYGDLKKAPFNENQISGNLKFDTTFSCTFKTTTDNACVNTCNQIPNQSGKDACLSTCTHSSCSKDVYVAMGLYTNSPNLTEDYDRLVNGSMGIFKRFYPKVGVDSVLTEIKDIPGAATVNYSASGANVEALAGSPGLNRGGSEAQIFFPHLGSVEEYFLKGIQKALRPQGFDSEPLPGQPKSDPVDQNFQTIACPGPQQIGVPSSALSCGVPPECASVKDGSIPAQYLALKGRVNTYALALAGRGSNLVNSCFDYVVKKSLDAQVNPIFTLSIWVQESAASNYSRFGCTLQDFGVNDTSIAAELPTQLSRFLNLAYKYPNSSANSSCFPDKKCSAEGFAQIFKNGNCPISTSGVTYSDKTKNTAKAIAPNCDFPIYPTQMTSCH
jgi:hypothetical protein